MDMFHDSLQRLTLQQALSLHDDTANSAMAVAPAASGSSDTLFQVEQSLYAAFQHSASCITQLYKQKHGAVTSGLDGDTWQAFQRAAAAATMLYREASDAVRKAQEIVKLSESNASAKQSPSAANMVQQSKRTRRSGLVTKRHADLFLSDRQNLPSTELGNSGNSLVPPGVTDDDESAVTSSRSSNVPVSNSDSFCARSESNSSGTWSCESRKRPNMDESACLDANCAQDSSLRLANAPPLPADFERASVEYFRAHKRPRF